MIPERQDKQLPQVNEKEEWAVPTDGDTGHLVESLYGWFQHSPGLDNLRFSHRDEEYRNLLQWEAIRGPNR